MVRLANTPMLRIGDRLRQLLLLEYNFIDMEGLKFDGLESFGDRLAISYEIKDAYGQVFFKQEESDSLDIPEEFTANDLFFDGSVRTPYDSDFMMDCGLSEARTALKDISEFVRLHKELIRLKKQLGDENLAHLNLKSELNRKKLMRRQKDDQAEPDQDSLRIEAFVNIERVKNTLTLVELKLYEVSKRLKKYKI